MNELQEIKIDGKEYLIVDSIQNLRAEDSFIYNKNKLKMFNGSGEARKYIGSYTGENGKTLSDFFEYPDWGQGKVASGRVYTPIPSYCFFSKNNLLKYLHDAYTEYQLQEQVYKHDISELYHTYLQTINQLNDENIYFTIYDVSDFIGKGSRAYIRSDDPIWKIWRKIILPKVSYLSILKLVPKNRVGQSPLFYFRVFLDYQFRSIIHPQLPSANNEVIAETDTGEAVRRSSYREGQALYRKKVITHMPLCPFTQISDERLLIASHIKPYQVCINENKVDEANDFYNGLALSPSYDKLFDRGYITFTDEGKLICGTQLSPYTWEKLNINPNSKKQMNILPEGRKLYLEYHRQNVFQDNLGDLI